MTKRSTEPGLMAPTLQDEPPKPLPILGVRGRSITLGGRWPPVVVAVLAAGIAWFRVPSGQRNTLYAEDGVLFVHDWVVSGRLSLFWKPYAGYQHLIPRAVSWFVTTTLPVGWWGIAVTAIACGLVGVIAALVYRCSADVIGYLPSRVVLGLITALIPIAGVEPLGNLANLHWFLLYLTPWVLIAVPRSWSGLWALAIVALLAAATEPQAVIFLPLALWRFITFPRSRVVLIGWALGIGAQGITYLTAPRDSVPGRPPWMSLIEGYVLDGGMSIVTSRANVLGWTIVHWGWWIGFVWVAGLLTFAAVGFLLGRATVRAMQLSLVVGSIACWSLAFFLNNVPLYYFSFMTPEQLANPPLLRWGTSASLLLTATIPVTVAVLVERIPRCWPAAIVVLSLMLLAMVVNMSNRSIVPGLDWSNQVEGARDTCAADPNAQILLQTQPATWQVALPCSVVVR